MASARLSGWRRAQRGEREKIGQGPGRRRGEESEGLVFGVFGESERASGVRALLLGRRSFWFCGVVQGGVRWKGASLAFVRRRRYHSVCRSEESSVGRKQAASAACPSWRSAP